MQPNIPMKFAGYVAWILLCKHWKFGEKIYYNSRDIEFFLGDYFFWRALYISVTYLLPTFYIMLNSKTSAMGLYWEMTNYVPSWHCSQKTMEMACAQWDCHCHLAKRCMLQLEGLGMSSVRWHIFSNAWSMSLAGSLTDSPMSHIHLRQN